MSILARMRAYRLTAQSVTAAVVTYAVASFAGLPQTTWAVISALYVVQGNVGGTLGMAVDRLGGTLLGTALGLAAILIGHEPLWLRGLELALVTTAVTVATGWRSGLRYGVVPGAIVVLGPTGGTGAVVEALEIVLAIAVGTGIATVTALVVLPMSAHRAAAFHLGRAVHLCGRLAARYLDDIAGNSDASDPGREARLNEEILGELEKAETLARQSRRPLARYRRRRMAHPLRVYRAVLRLWHTLLMVDRLNVGPLPEGPRTVLAEPLGEFKTCACQYLGELGDSVSEFRDPPSRQRVMRAIRHLREVLDGLRSKEAIRTLPEEATERVFMLVYSLDQVARDLDRVARRIGGNPDVKETAEGGGNGGG